MDIEFAPLPHRLKHIAPDVVFPEKAKLVVFEDNDGDQDNICEAPSDQKPYKIQVSRKYINQNLLIYF